MFGFGMDTSSATSQSAPFFNNAGINFGGDQGGIEASGDFGADATATAQGATPSRQTAGGINPLPTEVAPVGLNLGGGGNFWLYIVGAVLAVGAVIYLNIKK